MTDSEAQHGSTQDVERVASRRASLGLWSGMVAAGISTVIALTRGRWNDKSDAGLVPMLAIAAFGAALFFGPLLGLLFGFLAHRVDLRVKASVWREGKSATVEKRG